MARKDLTSRAQLYATVEEARADGVRMAALGVNVISLVKEVWHDGREHYAIRFTDPAGALGQPSESEHVWPKFSASETIRLAELRRLTVSERVAQYSQRQSDSMDIEKANKLVAEGTINAQAKRARVSAIISNLPPSNRKSKKRVQIADDDDYEDGPAD